jgi:hypothetical protein
VDRVLALEGNYSNFTVRSSIAGSRVAPNETKSIPNGAGQYGKEEEEEEDAPAGI